MICLHDNDSGIESRVDSDVGTRAIELIGALRDVRIIVDSGGFPEELNSGPDSGCLDIISR